MEEDVNGQPIRNVGGMQDNWADAMETTDGVVTGGKRVRAAAGLDGETGEDSMGSVEAQGKPTDDGFSLVVSKASKRTSTAKRARTEGAADQSRREQHDVSRPRSDKQGGSGSKQSTTSGPSAPSPPPVYRPPPSEVLQFRYDATRADDHEFFVYIDNTDDGHIGGRRPMEVGKLLYDRGIQWDNFVRKGRTRIQAIFNSAVKANECVDKIQSDPACGLLAYVPSACTSRQGIIRGVTGGITEKDLTLLSRTPEGIPISKALRLSRTDKSGQRVPTNTWRITVAGEVLPSRVLLFGVSLPVSVYVPPVLMCRNCLRFGHPTRLCRSATAQRCSKCESPDHGQDDCSAQPKCHHCGGEHSTFDRLCPKWAEEREVKSVMAANRISYAAALVQRSSRADPRDQPAASQPSAGTAQPPKLISPPPRPAPREAPTPRPRPIAASNPPPGTAAAPPPTPLSDLAALISSGPLAESILPALARIVVFLVKAFRDKPPEDIEPSSVLSALTSATIGAPLLSA